MGILSFSLKEDLKIPSGYIDEINKNISICV